jgi:hypothetical protein
MCVFCPGRKIYIVFIFLFFNREKVYHVYFLEEQPAERAGEYVAYFFCIFCVCVCSAQGLQFCTEIFKISLISVGSKNICF